MNYEIETDPIIDKFLKTIVVNNFYSIFISVKTFQEGCVFAAEVKVKLIENPPKTNIIGERFEFRGISVYISKDFIKYFPYSNIFKLKMKRKFRKKIICVNIPPLIVKTCKK